MPRAADTGAFLNDDKVVTLIAFDEVNCHAHALQMLAVETRSLLKYLPEIPAPIMTTAASV
jgi:hypothetical protein